MQNLTSKYNILYNANETVNHSKLSLDLLPDDYDHLLSVYKEPTETTAQAEIQNLDSVIFRANVIINEKLNSKYIDDAYLLIGIANYYKANFFNASEFFKYVYTSYPDNKKLCDIAWIWKARADLQLRDTADARQVLDSTSKYLSFLKKHNFDFYATKAQLKIRQGDQDSAIILLKKAIAAKPDKSSELRWKYVLAQLQDNNNLPADAYKNYTAIVKSNAPFEMAFNANLNRIEIEDERDGKSGTKLDHLKTLLKDDKNADFKDQIYYRMGEIYASGNDVDHAVKQYNLSLRNSTKNEIQKGLGYYRLAEINFKNGNYVPAKAYYDSTLTSLPSSYPGYALIRLKGSNLDLLANRFQIISREDTLQSLARLPEAQRDLRIGELVREQVKKATGETAPVSGPFTAGIDNSNRNTITEGKFYFNNVTAISQGMVDFKRRWGNRKLEDNWRRNSKNAVEAVNSGLSNDPDGGASLPGISTSTAVNEADYRKFYDTNIPLKNEQILISNQNIINAYYDVGNFYKDELKDNAEAIKAYSQILARYPENKYKLPIYYNLYRLYAETDPKKSAQYFDTLTHKYPESPYAKILIDPNYSQKMDEKLVALNQAYNEVYDLYANKNYKAVIEQISKYKTQFPDSNQVAPQLDYLKSLAIGHTQKLLDFETTLIQLVASYPNDKVVTPLVKQHLEYIKTNRELMGRRSTALVKYDPNEPKFVEEPVLQTVNKALPNAVSQKPGALANAQKPPAQPSQQPTATTNTTSATILSKPTNALFSLPEGGEYYFVINVTDMSVTLSSSRFGVGQFNRSNFPDGQIKHQLKIVNNQNQLIYVGAFTTLESAKNYERNIIPIMKDIMKVRPEKYNTFVITKAGLDKLTDRSMVETYIDFYKQQ